MARDFGGGPVRDEHNGLLLQHHFEKSGLPYPDDDWTWDDLIDVSRRLVRRDGSGAITRFALKAPPITAIMVYGAPFFSEDGKRTLMNNSATIAALQYYADVMSPGMEIHSPSSTAGVVELNQRSSLHVQRRRAPSAEPARSNDRRLGRSGRSLR